MKRTTRGSKMLEAAREQLERDAKQAKRAKQAKHALPAAKTPPTKAEPPKAPPALKRKKPRPCQFV